MEGTHIFSNSIDVIGTASVINLQITGLTAGSFPVVTTNGRLIDSIISQTSSTVIVSGTLSATYLVGGGLGITGSNHELLIGLSGGSASIGHYHSDQPINMNNDVQFNSVELAAGTTTQPPLKFTNGDLLSVAEEGAIEYKDDEYKATISTGVFSSQYPPAYSDTYVKATTYIDATYAPYRATDPSNPLIGNYDLGTWLASAALEQRFHIDLGSAKTITRVYYENNHASGAVTSVGAKNFTLWGSNNPTAFDELTYAIDDNWTLLSTDVSQFLEHVTSNVPDPKYVYVANTTAYRYYAFKFVDNYGGSYLGVRRIELQSGVSGNPRKGIILNDGTNLTNTYFPVAQTNGRLIDSIITQVNGEVVLSGTLSATYLVGDGYGINHETLSGLSGGSASIGHYHSNQPINISNNVQFNSVELAAGTTTQPPLKFTNGDLLSVSEEGAIEYSDDEYKATISTGVFSSQYPPAYSDTYVKATNVHSSNTFLPHNTTDPSKSLVGDWQYNEWLTDNAVVSNQRFHIDLGSSKIITRVYYENGHTSGGYTTSGAKTFTLWGSNNGSDFVDLVYDNDGTWSPLSTDAVQFQEHIALDQVDPKYIYVANTTSYRYYAFKFADNWGGSYMAIRRIELQSGVSGNPRKGIILNDGTNLTNTYFPVAQTNGRLIDSIITQVNGEVVLSGTMSATYLVGDGSGITGSIKGTYSGTFSCNDGIVTVVNGLIVNFSWI